MKRTNLSKNILVFAILLCVAQYAIGQSTVQPDNKFKRADRAIMGQYVVVLDDNISKQILDSTVQEMARASGGKINFTYKNALKGFAVSLAEKQAELLSKDPRVKYVIEDAEATVADAQFNAPASIDRIDQRSLPLDATYIFNGTGSGVHVYIIDSGIRTTHQDFNGRALASYEAVSGGGVPYAGDCTGHGTMVASIIGGMTYGVAKNSLLHSVRVFGCSLATSNSAIIAGVDWVTTNRQLPAVANMSLGSSGYAPLDQAVINSINSGVTYVAAAGNDGSPASNYSPARIGQVITVGATDFSDTRASFSNYGSALDLFAPGVNIQGASHTGDNAIGTASGTSFSSPLVAGVAALYLERAPTASPFTVSSTILSTRQ